MGTTGDSALGGPRQRLASLDVLRGLVIVIMVLDHVRDFLHVDANRFDPLDPAHTTAILYATRWITNFCAPTFVFLAGASAWLQRARGRDTREISTFLVTRGLWLVLLELTILGFGWSFSIPYLIFLQVIWAIGCSMVILAACVWLPSAAVLALGILIIAGHNLADTISPEALGNYSHFWMALHVLGVWSHDGRPYLLLAYPVIPWLGVMLLGYGMGGVFLLPAARRDRLLPTLGLAMIAAFLVLRYFNLYGDPKPWEMQPTLAQSVMALLRVEKYPPSLCYILATLGPVFTLLPLIERWRGRLPAFFIIFGSVPLFAYVAHIYLAHTISIALRVVTGHSLAGQFDQMRIEVTHPELLQDGYSLGVVYVAWVAIVLSLYPLCRWYAGVKRRRRDWWLSYL